MNIFFICEVNSCLEGLLKGQNVGLLSDAGCPGIADPGAEVVKLAHKNGVKVVPLVGPSSILMALISSGMNGQKLCLSRVLAETKARQNQ